MVQQSLSSAAIFTAILDGKGSQAQNDVVCANAAMAIATATNCTPLRVLKKQKSPYSRDKQPNHLKHYKISVHHDYT